MIRDRWREGATFLALAWGFVAYNAVGALVGWLAALPTANGVVGDVHTVGSEAIWGNGTALSPPLDLLALVALCAWAAGRRGRARVVGVTGTLVFALFYLAYGATGELTTSTSPLTGARWGAVVGFDSVGLAIAAGVVVAGTTVVGRAARARRSARASAG